MKGIHGIAFILAIVCTAQKVALAQFVNGQNADVVLGQPNFTSSASATTQSGMQTPTGVTVDPTTGKVFVSDTYNNRVLRFSSIAASISGSPAEAVLGQPDFTSNAQATTQNGMYQPFGLTMDSFGTLYVTDFNNSRVLRFDNASAKANGANADGVLGQAGFTTRSFVTTQNGMSFPFTSAVDPSGNLYVADLYNSRVLRFNNAAAKPNGSNADGVLGQPNFTSNTPALTQSGMYKPGGVTVDAAGNLYVGEGDGPNYNRVLRFNNAIAKPNGANADGVLGQSNFTSSTPATTQSGMNNAAGVAVDAFGTLYVADFGNSRVLWFTNAATKLNGANADGVLGQANFTTATVATTQNKMNDPSYVALDATGNLYVTDYYNRRVLRFNRTPIAPVNVAPVITDQMALSTDLNESITISLSDLIVVDPDNNYPADFTLTVQSGVDYTESGTTITPAPTFTGALVVPVSVNDGTTDSNVFSLSVDVTAAGSQDITIFNALSPNGDSKNEVFLIENIDILADTKENKVTIFNRWGAVVFEVENYDNAGRVFQGLNSNGSALPSGTYYYRIEFKSGAAPRTGFISLKK